MLVNDSFTNTNGTALSTHNANWTVHNGSYTIEGNELQPNNPGNDSWATYAGTFDPDQFAESVISSTIADNNFAGLVVRCNTSGTKTYYGLNWDNTRFYFYKYNSGSYNPFEGPVSGADPTPGDLVRLEIVGTTLSFYLNGVLTAQTTDGSIASGNPGVTGFNGTGTRQDDWVGGDVVQTRKAEVSWAEFEVPNVPHRAQVSWAELEVPNVPHRAQVSWAELQVPNAPARAQVSWAELQVPDYILRRARISWAEVQVPTAPARCYLSWAEFECPNVPGSYVYSYSNLTGGLHVLKGGTL